MRLGPVELPLLDMPRLGVAAFRNRIVFHLVFIALAVATLALAVALLSEEKQRNAQRYEQGFRKSLGEITAQLRHPAGQLALLNPDPSAVEPGWVAPLLLPFSAIDFDDQTKAQRAVEMAGCERPYADGASLCAAVGSNAYAGGFIYLVAGFDAPPLVGRERGSVLLAEVHRASITLKLRGSEQHWIAPLELLDAGRAQAQPGQRGQLPGFVVAPADGTTLPHGARPQREFRGWLWRSGPCLGAEQPDCARRAHLSIRLPVEAFREALFRPGAPVWPPADLNRVALRLSVEAPSGQAALFDSARAVAAETAPLARISAGLAPGETLAITRDGRLVATLQGAEAPDAPASPWLTALIARLPSPVTQPSLQARDTVVTPLGRFELTLTGDLQGQDRALSATATRLAWPVGAMLGAIALAWLIIEMGLIRRVATLTKRAAAVAYNVQAPNAEARLGELQVNDLRGRDELGILAGSLADLLQRVKDGLRLDALRQERERDHWHAVGHEIMSPLQSLLALHADPADASHRYLRRMQQAVKLLYGQASPAEALAGATLDVARLDLDAFLRQVAENAAFAGIEQVAYAPRGEPLWVLADEYPLEDAVTHVLQNAARYRPAGSPITLSVEADAELVRLGIHNIGPAIPADQLERIFEYGVSDTASIDEHRGQGLFVTKTYLAKMGGSIRARNAGDGVEFEIALRRG
jgi:signal transduction histidine kinase